MPFHRRLGVTVRPGSSEDGGSVTRMPRNPMDVLYEVTNLGLAFGTSLTRTGSYRATESFVRAALTHPGLRPRFAALESYIGELQLVRLTSGLADCSARRVSA